MKSRLAGALVTIALTASACARSTPQSGSSNAQFARERLVSAPSEIACVSTDRDAPGLRSEIRLGGQLGRSALYLKFPNEWRRRGIPEQAFLTLSARAGSASSNEPVTLEAWRVSNEWQPRTLQRWSDKPGLAPPYARARISSSPAQDVRIDITELVRFAAQNPERDFGFAVIASASEGPGLTFNTGFAGGLAPRLELYLR